MKKDFIELRSWGDGGAELELGPLSLYICMSCGHIDLYANDGMRNFYKNEFERNKATLEIEKNIKNQTKEQTKLLNDKICKLHDKKNELACQVAKLETDASNEDLTIRQSKELLAQIPPIKNEILTIDAEIKKCETEIEHIQTKEPLKIEKEINELDKRFPTIRYR